MILLFAVLSCRAIRNISSEVSVKKGTSLWSAYGDEGSRGDSLTYFEVSGEKSGWTTIPGERGVNALSPRFVELFAPLSSTQREGKCASAFLHPFVLSRSRIPCHFYFW